MKGDCNKSLKMLLSQGIEDLHDDGFEGTVDEHLIFSEIFFGNDSGRSSKRCLVTGVINFGNGKGNSEAGFLSEDCNLLMRNDPDVEVKRMKLSVDELSTAKPYTEKVVNSSAPSKEEFSGLCPPTSTKTCCLVESSSKGVTSSCYLLKEHVDNLGDRDISKCKLSSVDESEQKALVVSKAIASPVSQESSASKLLVSKSESLRRHKPKWKDSCFVELDKEELSIPKDSASDPRPLLRYHIHRLLRAAGWVIGRRKRSIQYKGHGEYVYKSPEGRPIREFHRAWHFCGQRLYADAKHVVHEFDGKQWMDLTQFRSDLHDTLIEIQEQPNSMDAASALASWWYLLDPFAKVVFIDKKLSSLKEGRLVKAKRSIVGDSYLKQDAVLRIAEAPVTISDQPSDSSLVSDSELTVFEEQCEDRSLSYQGQSRGRLVKTSKVVSSSPCEAKCKSTVDRVYVSGNKFRKISRKEGSKLGPCSFPACRSDSSSGLYEVPICSGNANSYGGAESVSPHQGCSTSSLKCHKNRAGHCDEMPLRVLKDVLKASHRNEGKTFEGKVADKMGNLLKGSLDDHSYCTNDGFAESHDSCRTNLQLNQRGYDLRGPSLVGDGCLVDTEDAELCPGYIRKEDGQCFGAQQFRMDDACFAADAVLKRKAHKKSKKISELTLTEEKRSKQKKSMMCQLKDDDLLLSAIIKSKNFSCTSKPPNVKRNFRKSRALRKYKSQKGSCRLLARSLNKSGQHYMEGRWSGLGVRTVLSWLINSGVICVNDVIQYRNPKNDAVVKDGLVTEDGILCRCCDKVLSITEFKSHAGFRQKRPCLNLFMESGKPFTLCQLEAWSAEYKVRKSATRTVQVEDIDENDDSCGLCGDGGELICCDNCPSTFHQACLYAQELPEGNWYCAQCSCWICGDAVNEKEALGSPVALKCSQCEHKYHEECLKGKGITGVVPDTWFCGESCQAVHSGLNSRIGLVNSSSDGFSWTLLRCIRGDQKVHSAQRYVALKAECNLKLAVALTIMEECFLPMVDPRTGIDMIPHVLYNWGSEFARLNYHGFHTVVLEKDDVLMSVASLRIHGEAVAEMPLIATCSKYRRQGMCRRLMNAIEEMLKSFKVEKLVVSAIPSLVETWTVGFGFTPLEDHEKESLSRTNLMVFPGTVWLKKPLAENQVAVEETDDPAEAAVCLEEGPTVEPSQQNNTSSGSEANSGNGIMPVDCHLSQADPCQDGNSKKDSSCKELASPLGNNLAEADRNVETVIMYDNREPVTNEQSKKTDVLHRNEIKPYI